MLTLEQAQAAVAQTVIAVTEQERVPLTGANGRYLARPAAAVVANPGFDNSSMDGYAVNTRTLVERDFMLPVVGESSCGDAPGVLAADSCMRIFTGAPVPKGADAVVIQEDIKIVATGDGDRVQFPHSVQPQQNIRYAGEDFKAGDSFFAVGHRLNPRDIALLSAAGVVQVEVWRRPRVLVLATGNELVSPGEALKPGQIYESNRLATILMLQQLGVDVTDGGTVRDEADDVRAALTRARDYDFTITSGGVSVGDHDLVKKIFAEFGDINFWKVRIKPGKPVAFGRLGEHGHFLGFPGNPVSSLVTFKLFLEPALCAWHHAPYLRTELAAIVESDFTRHAGRTEFLRARVTLDTRGQLHAHILPGQGSHMLGTMQHANALLRVEHDVSEVKRGQTAPVMLLASELPIEEY